jgi:hypothetical protein
VKNRFQSLPFKCNLHRYTVADNYAEQLNIFLECEALDKRINNEVGLHKLNAV